MQNSLRRYSESVHKYLTQNAILKSIKRDLTQAYDIKISFEFIFVFFFTFFLKNEENSIK